MTIRHSAVLMLIGLALVVVTVSAGPPTARAQPWTGSVDVCLQTAAEVDNCDTCSNAGGQMPPANATYSMTVSEKAQDPPQTDCEACAWKATIIFGPQATIDYSNTFIQVGTGTKHNPTSPETSLTYEWTNECSTTSAAVNCVEGHFEWTGGGDISICWKSKCCVCAATTCTL